MKILDKVDEFVLMVNKTHLNHWAGITFMIYIYDYEVFQVYRYIKYYYKLYLIFDIEIYVFVIYNLYTRIQENTETITFNE